MFRLKDCPELGLGHRVLSTVAGPAGGKNVLDLVSSAAEQRDSMVNRERCLHSAVRAPAAELFDRSAPLGNADASASSCFPSGATDVDVFVVTLAIPLLPRLKRPPP